MCEHCTAPRPPGPTSRGGPATGLPAPRRPGGVWPHLSGVRGHLSLHPLRSRQPDVGGAVADVDEGLRLVVRGHLDRRVVQWADEVDADVLPRVEVVCTTGLTHLDDAGRALLVDLVRLARRRGRPLHLPAPSAAVTTVLARLGLLDAVDRGPDPWAPPVGGAGGGSPR